jgi:hypothetical protein
VYWYRYGVENNQLQYLHFLFPCEIWIGPDVELLHDPAGGWHVAEGHHHPVEDVGEVGQRDGKQCALGLGLKRKRFFYFREKRKSCANEVIFARFREISFRFNFRFRVNFRFNFRFRENFRFNFRFRENFRFNFRFRENFCMIFSRKAKINFCENTKTKMFVSTLPWVWP